MNILLCFLITLLNFRKLLDFYFLRYVYFIYTYHMIFYFIGKTLKEWQMLLTLNKSKMHIHTLLLLLILIVNNK